MKKEELDKLLEKYYDGSSTEEEQKALKKFFTGSDLPEGYETEKAIFRYYRDMSEIPEPSADLDERIISALDKQLSTGRKPIMSKSVLAISAAAAVLIIISGSWFFLTHGKRSGDTFSDPEIAYAETIKILYNVSVRMNEGTSALEPVSKMNVIPVKDIGLIERSAETVMKSLGRLNYLQQVIELTNYQSGKINKK